MTSIVVDRLPHICGSKRGLNVFSNEDGTYSGFCFKCKTYIPSPYEDKPKDYSPPVGFKKSPEEIRQELKAIGEFKAFAIKDRKLKKETLDYFETKISVSEEDGETPVAHYYPYKKQGVLTGYKCRLVESKKFWGIGNVKDADFFGWDKAIQTGSKRLYITEGELDALSLFQIIDENTKEAYKDIKPAVVSLINGSSSAG